MNILRDCRIENALLSHQTLYLSEGHIEAITGCTLRNCHLVVDSVSCLGLYYCRLEDCLVECKRKLKNVSALGNSLTACKFTGKFLGVDFGKSPWLDETPPTATGLGIVKDCDFTEATLDLCRFFSVDPQFQRFASWPQLIVTRQNAFALAANLSLPGNLSRYVQLWKDQNLSMTILTGTVPDFCKRYDVSVDNIRSLIAN